MTAFKTIRAEQLETMPPGKGIIVDVRTKMEHSEKHLGLEHAHVPLDELKPTDFMMRHGLDKMSNVYVLCRSGKRAAQAAEKFAAEGYQNVHVIEGGIIACEDCGQDVKGYGAGGAPSSIKGPVSLERQVRIAAGFLAATGAALGLVVSPLFTLIPLFVGIGLIVAGVTDRCGMALVLTKAPWNKTACGSSCGSGSCSTSPAGAKTGQSCQ